MVLFLALSRFLCNSLNHSISDKINFGIYNVLNNETDVNAIIASMAIIICAINGSKKHTIDDIKYILDENSQSTGAGKIAQPDQSESAPLPSAADSALPVNEELELENSKNIDTSIVRTLKELEHEAIVRGLERTNWNMTTTAQQLGISRMTLYRKLDQHGLRKKD